SGPEKRFSPGREFSTLEIFQLWFAGRRFPGFRIRRRRRASRNGLRSFGHVAHQVRHKRRHFERHLLAFRHRPYRLALDQIQLVVPRIQLYPSADRKRRDHLWVWLLIAAGHRGPEGTDDRDAIAEVRADYVGDLLLPRLQSLEKQRSI